jgi:hypothetical protein
MLAQHAVSGANIQNGSVRYAPTVALTAHRYYDPNGRLSFPQGAEGTLGHMPSW